MVTNVLSLTDMDVTTPSSRDSGGSIHKRHGLFQYVKKTLPSLRSQLVKSKELALGKKHGRTIPCKVSKCMCCNLIMDVDSLRVNGKHVRCAPGNCKTYNIVYLVQCSLCKKAYTGRSIQPLHERLNGHRSKYYEIIEGRASDVTDDEHSLGIHLVDHGFNSRDDFNNVFKVCILDNCSPKSLEYKENQYIHLLNTLRPAGLNTINPFGLKILH